VMARHDRGSFPERVDFLNGPGFLDGGTSRTDRGLPEGGPKLVLSPFGVFDFEPTSKRMRVRSLHPGITVEQVQQQTGFELLVEGTPPVTSMPLAEELSVLREKVDSTGVLRERRRA
jgi:glutaconate CoA-transferase, subunit B